MLGLISLSFSLFCNPPSLSTSFCPSSCLLLQDPATRRLPLDQLVVRQVALGMVVDEEQTLALSKMSLEVYLPAQSLATDHQCRRVALKPRQRLGIMRTSLISSKFLKGKKGKHLAPFFMPIKFWSGLILLSYLP